MSAWLVFTISNHVSMQGSMTYNTMHVSNHKGPAKVDHNILGYFLNNLLMMACRQVKALKFLGILRERLGFPEQGTGLRIATIKASSRSRCDDNMACELNHHEDQKKMKGPGQLDDQNFSFRRFIGLKQVLEMKQKPSWQAMITKEENKRVRFESLDLFALMNYFF